MFIISSFSKKDSVITRNFFTRYKTRKKINFKWCDRFGAFWSKMSTSMFQYCPRQISKRTNKKPIQISKFWVIPNIFCFFLPFSPLQFVFVAVVNVVFFFNMKKFYLLVQIKFNYIYTRKVIRLLSLEFRDIGIRKFPLHQINIDTLRKSYSFPRLSCIIHR